MRLLVRGRVMVAMIATMATLAMVAACSAESEPPLVAADVRVVGPMPDMQAGYMTLTNNSDAPIRITSITSPEYLRAELHETNIENDVARMRPLEALNIGPGETLSLEPGGKHLMLMQPVGNVSSVTFNLFADDSLLLTVRAARPDL